MKEFFSNLAKKFKGTPNYEEESKKEEEYLELDTAHTEEKKQKILVRRFIIEEFDDTKIILDVFREGKTIGFINIKPLKDKDLVELKRAINKLKKTSEAMEGEIAGFGEDWLVLVPSFAKVYKGKPNQVQEAPKAKEEIKVVKDDEEF